MNKPPKLVLDEVQRRWPPKHSKGILTKLIDFIIIRPIAIEVVQTDSFDEKTNRCTGKTLNRWRYNDLGLQSLSDNADEEEQKLDYCYYCLDKEKKKLVIEWSSMFSGALKGSRIKHPYNHGEIYEVIECNGVEEYRLIRCWIE